MQRVTTGGGTNARARKIPIFFCLGSRIRLHQWPVNGDKAELNDAMASCLGLSTSSSQVKGRDPALAIWVPEKYHLPREMYEGAEPEGMCGHWEVLDDMEKVHAGCKLTPTNLVWRAAIRVDQVSYEENRRVFASIRQAASGSTEARIWLNNLLNEPSSSKVAAWVSVFMMLLILLSTVAYIAETLPHEYTDESVMNEYFWIETVCIAFFTLEYLLRLLAAPNAWKFVLGTMNLIDLVAIIPYYIEVALTGVQIPGLQVLRVMRLVRVLRLLRVGQGSLRVLIITLQRSLRPMQILVFMLGMAILVMSSLLHFLERGRWNAGLQTWEHRVAWTCSFVCSAGDLGDRFGMWRDCRQAGDVVDIRVPMITGPFSEDCREVWEESKFASIPHTFWFCVVTLTTLGYGEDIPYSPAGRIAASVTMMFGLLTISLPISVIGSRFLSVFEKLGGNRNQLVDEDLTVSSESVDSAGDGMDMFRAHRLESLRLSSHTSDNLSRMNERLKRRAKRKGDLALPNVFQPGEW
ncbi:unnamed protein product [Pedinophyceae sp. YPF-701]|nr:unnamed protein product [Pedinophyceae sp. YPF-701]